MCQRKQDRGNPNGSEEKFCAIENKIVNPHVAAVKFCARENKIVNPHGAAVKFCARELIQLGNSFVKESDQLVLM